jgi:hypothetical protein
MPTQPKETPMPKNRPRRLKCNYGLPHVQPEPRIEDFVEVWPPINVISARKVWDTIKALGPDMLQREPEYYHFYSDFNYFDVPQDVMWWLASNSRTRKMPGSTTLVVANPEQLHSSAQPTETYEDGSWLINGSTGDCDSVAKSFYGEMKLFAAVEGIGLELCIGKLSKSPNPHEQNWCISEGVFYMVEPRGAESTFMRLPSTDYKITKIEL